MFKPAMRALKKIAPDAEDMRDHGVDEATEQPTAPPTPKARKVATFTRALARK